MFRVTRRPRPEEVAAAHARLARLFAADAAPNEPAPVVTGGGWVPETPDRAVAPAPVGWQQRIGMRSTAAAALVGVAAAAALLAGGLAWRARPHPVSAPAPPAMVAAPTPSGIAPSAAASVVVDVAGRVRKPGLVTLPDGARVADALRAAGGARPGTDLTALNLARRVVDGEQILVGGAGAPAPSAGGVAPAPGTAPGAAVDLNTGTLEQLDQLPGIGPVLAQRIVDWRTQHGPFRNVSQLQEVSGIGDSRYAELQPLVRV